MCDNHTQWYTRIILQQWPPIQDATCNYWKQRHRTYIDSTSWEVDVKWEARENCRPQIRWFSAIELQQYKHDGRSCNNCNSTAALLFQHCMLLVWLLSLQSEVSACLQRAVSCRDLVMQCEPVRNAIRGAADAMNTCSICMNFPRPLLSNHCLNAMSSASAMSNDLAAN